MKSYKLSVRLMTYNHGRYIEEALKGIDIQKTDFNFEVVVGDDFSTDETLSKIKNYNFCNPNLHLRVLEREIGDSYYKERIKKGRLYNFVDILNNCKGNYIALLDGDDYWTDPSKLQKQVDFLEENKDYTFCSHHYFLKKGDLVKKIELPYREVTIKNIFKKNIFSSASLLFKKEAMENISKDIFLNIPAGDWTLQAFACQTGSGFALPEYMSVYRHHEKALWSTLPSLEMGKRGLKVLECFLEIFSKRKEQKLIKEAIESRKKEFGLSTQKNFIDRLKRRYS